MGQSLEQRLAAMDDNYAAAREILSLVKVSHEVQTEENRFIHRIVVDGNEGPWVAKVAIAANGPFRATTVHYEEYFGLPMPRLFFVLPIQHHPHHQVRQPGEGIQRSPAKKAVSNPGPGADEGAETDSSSALPRADGDSVPRFEFPHSEGSPPTDFCISVMRDGSLDVDVGAEYGGIMNAEEAARMAAIVLKRTD